MSYEIVKSIVIKKDRVFSRMDSNNVYPKDFISMENPGLTRIYNEKGLMGLYVSLVEGGLSGYLHFQKGGNKLVKQLERITDSLFEDKQYRNMKNEADKLEYKLWDFKEENEEKKQCKQEYDKYSEKLHNYVDLKVREFFNPKLKVPDSIKRELDNVLEMYEENLENDEEDIFSGTEESYANEVLNQDIFNVLNRDNVEKIMALNNNMFTLLNIDFRNKSYEQIVEQITDKLYEKFVNCINILDEIIEVKENEKDEISEALTV